MPQAAEAPEATRLDMQQSYNKSTMNTARSDMQMFVDDLRIGEHVSSSRAYDVTSTMTTCGQGSVKPLTGTRRNVESKRHTLHN